MINVGKEFYWVIDNYREINVKFRVAHKINLDLIWKYLRCDWVYESWWYGDYQFWDKNLDWTISCGYLRN